MKSPEKIFMICFLVCIMCIPARAANRYRPSSADALVVISQKQLRSDIEFLSDSLCDGRSCTQRGGSEAAMWTERRFRRLGLVPFDGHYGWGFDAQGHRCHNIIGMLPVDRSYDNAGYIIVGAHYDNIGRLDGKLYPGADSNASGMAAMLSIADLFRYVRSGGGKVRQNIIFVAFDAKQLSLAGSYAMMDLIEEGKLTDPYSGKTIRKEDITVMVNLDILGSTASPIHKENPNYLLMLGGKTEHNNLLRTASYRFDSLFDLAYDYYGSSGFTDMFLNRVSDQRAFREHGVYSVLFTSGITMNINRTTDTIETLDLSVLKNRICLISRWIDKVMNMTAN